MWMRIQMCLSMHGVSVQTLMEEFAYLTLLAGIEFSHLGCENQNINKFDVSLNYPQ